MAPPNTGMMGRQRDFGMQGGPGKGSKTRVSDNKKFHENYDAIDWGKPKPKPKKENGNSDTSSTTTGT